MRFYFEKENGVIKTAGMRAHIDSLKDGMYRMEIVRDYKARSPNQNNLLHAWLMQLEKDSHVGYTAEEWKEVFRYHYLTTTTKSPLDRRRKIPEQKSTTELSTVEFNEFLEKIRLAALTKNVGPVLLEYPTDPLPNEPIWHITGS